MDMFGEEIVTGREYEEYEPKEDDDQKGGTEKVWPGWLLILAVNLVFWWGLISFYRAIWGMIHR